MGAHTDCDAQEHHVEPIVDWIGDFRIAHGERGPDEQPAKDNDGEPYCLCGHPRYYVCPQWLAGVDTIAGVVVLAPEASA